MGNKEKRGGAPDVFISYSQQDRPKVLRIANALRAAGHEIWWDPEILPGQEYGDVIKSALETAKCVIVVWSEASVDSRWVRDEAAVGLDRRVLVPVSLDGVAPPLGFRQVQTADLSGWNGQLGSVDFRPVQTVVGRKVHGRFGEFHPSVLKKWRLVAILKTTLFLAIALTGLLTFGLYQSSGLPRRDIFANYVGPAAGMVFLPASLIAAFFASLGGRGRMKIRSLMLLLFAGAVSCVVYFQTRGSPSRPDDFLIPMLAAGGALVLLGIFLAFLRLIRGR